MAQGLRDKSIIITGASSGIGAATAIACGRAGMNVVVNARRRKALESVAEKVREAGGQAAIVDGDVTDPAVNDRLLDEAERHFGRADIVFANAGYGLEHSVRETGDDVLRNIFEVNFFASVDLVRKAATRWVRAKQHGHLLMCSSCVSQFALPFHGAYAATKASQHLMCQAMRLELKPHGIYVSSVHPITTATEFFASSKRRSGLPAHREIVGEHSPRLFIQSPERVSRAIIKCLSHPCPEVWTSHTVRFVAAFMTAFPRSYDLIMRSTARVGRRNLGERTPSALDTTVERAMHSKEHVS